MNSRPVSITVIAWILIAINAISLVSTLFLINSPAAQELMAKNPMPLSVQYAMIFAGLFVAVVCGIFMLKGANWARLLYVGWNVVAFAVNFITSPGKLLMVPGTIILAVIVFFLFRPNANAFFVRQPDRDVIA